MLRTSKFWVLRSDRGAERSDRCDLVKPFHLHAGVLPLPVEKGPIVSNCGIIQRGWIVVVRPSTVEHELGWDEIADFRDAGQLVAAPRGFRGGGRLAHVIVMEMRQVRIVEGRRRVMREHMSHIAGDPLARRL